MRFLVRYLEHEEVTQILSNGFFLFIDRNDVIAIIEQYQLFVLRRDLIKDYRGIAGAGHIVFLCLKNHRRSRDFMQSSANPDNESVNFRERS